MMKKLKNVFQTLITDPADTLPAEQYSWFLTDQNEMLGIQKKELTKTNIALLDMLLTPYNIQLPLPTEKEKMWSTYVHEENPKKELIAGGMFRFVYFSIQSNQTEPRLFKEAIQDLFAEEVAILWESNREGVIVEEQTSIEGSASYEQMIDVLMSDLYVKINFLVGPFRSDLTDVDKEYAFIVSKGKTALAHAGKPVISYMEAIPHILMDQAGADLLTEISNIILTSFLDDQEMLSTIEKFIACNLNVSETAKQLYMHRNSLQYRLDKFVEKTGIEIRQLQSAMAVYLALLANRKK